MTTAVALLSGGLDSAVAAAKFVADGGTLSLALFCDYGQRAARREEVASRALGRRWGVPWRGIELPWLAEASRTAGSALADASVRLPEGTAEWPGDAASAAAVWVPARNAVFVAIAAAFAEAMAVDAVVTGFNREEAQTFPDNSAAFLRAADAYLALGTRTQVRVLSPTIDLDKAGIVATARLLGLGAQDVWSCYTGDASPCGRCESCLRSRW